MSYSYSPYRTLTIPATITDNKTGTTYEVIPDADAEDPRGWLMPEEGALWILQSNYSTEEEYPPQNPVLEAMFEYLMRGYNYDDALKLALRHTRIFHPGRRYVGSVEYVRFDKSIWYKIAVVTDADVLEPSGLVSDWKAWARGDVWCVIPSDDDVPLSGIYADDEEDAFKQYLNLTR